MATPLRYTLQDPGIPTERKDPANWPEAMQEEWGNPNSAAEHRRALSSGFRRVRQALDELNPDVVLIWSDDQYENFKEDLIPPFAILGYDDMVVQPWIARTEPNYWNEDRHFSIKVRGAPEVARSLTTHLLESGFDMSYAYRPLHHDGFGHSFMNTILYLDQDRVGFPYPVICVPVNCYGRRVVSSKGRSTWFSESVDRPLDPPSPIPARCMDLGRAIVEYFADSGLNCAVVASSSWSHAFLVDKNWHLYPDLEADRSLYEALLAGNYQPWREWSLDQIEESGQQEMLNWFCLIGGMEALERQPRWTDYVETYVFNSNKCFAIL